MNTGSGAERRSAIAGGNPVKFRDGPAAVSGDEGFIQPLQMFKNLREGKAYRRIHKSEDLPEPY